MFDIDDAMGAVVANANQPALAAIKLAWWRERLEELDQGMAPAEPRLQAAAAELLPRGVSGAELAQLEQYWALLLNEKRVRFMSRAIERGPRLFGLGARLLGVSINDTLNDAGRDFAAVDFARRGLSSLPPAPVGQNGSRVARVSRPLTAFGVLARRDMRVGGPPFEEEATPGRAWALLRHWLSGKL